MSGWFGVEGSESFGDGVKHIGEAFLETAKAASKLVGFVIEAPAKVWGGLEDIVKALKEGTGDAYDLLTRPSKPREDLDIYKAMRPLPPGIENDPTAKTRWLNKERIRILKLAIKDIESDPAYRTVDLEVKSLDAAIERVQELQSAVRIRREKLLHEQSSRTRLGHRLDVPDESTLDLGSGNPEFAGMSDEEIEDEIIMLEGGLLMDQPWPAFQYDQATDRNSPIAGSERTVNLIARRNALMKDPAFAANRMEVDTYNYEIKANQWEFDNLGKKINRIKSSK